MIARLRAWLDRPVPADVLAARDTRIAQLEAKLAELQSMLSKEQMLNVGLASDVSRLTTQNIHLKQRAEEAEAMATRVRADAQFVQAARCECGGDPELYWRRQAAAAEEQARRDRANAVRMADEIERLQLRADEADRLVHIAEQLERAR